MFFGLHSSFINVVSNAGYSLLVFYSIVNLLSLLEMSMPTLPPFVSSLFISYPFVPFDVDFVVA